MKSKDKGGGARDATPSRTNEYQHRDSAEIDGDRKAVQAKAALIGCTVHELTDGGFLAVPCLRCVGDLLRQIGRGRP